MWIIIQSDGDVDYTSLYGPFDSKEEAEKHCPSDEDDYVYRVEPVQPAEKLLGWT